MGSPLTTTAAHGMTTTGTVKESIRVSNFEGEHEEAEREDNDSELASGFSHISHYVITAVLCCVIIT